MQVVTLGSIKKLLTVDTLIDGLYSILEAKQGSTLNLPKEFENDFDPCLIRLTLAKSQPSVEAWKTIQESDDRLIVVVNHFIASKLSLKNGFFTFKLHADSSLTPAIAKNFEQTDALWRFGVEYWEDTLKLMGSDLQDSTVKQVLESIRKTNPFYSPKFYFIFTNRWRCLTPKQFKTIFPDLPLDKKSICRTIDSRLVIFNWTAKELAPFAAKPFSLLDLF